MHNTIEERKKAFITLYHQNLDIIEIANALGVKVSELNKKTTWRGAIAFNRGRFSIIYNAFYVDNLFKRIEIIAHEMAHWIFDYDQIKVEPLFDEIGVETNAIEDRANKFAEFVLLGNVSSIKELQ